MGFDIRGAFAAVTQSAADAAANQLAEQAKGAYGTSLDVPTQQAPVKTGQLNTSLPPSTTEAAAPQSFMQRYGKVLGIVAVVGLVLVLVLKKRR